MGRMTPGKGAAKATRETVITCTRGGGSKPSYTCLMMDRTKNPAKWTEIGRDIDLVHSTAVDIIDTDGDTIYIDVSKRSFCTVDDVKNVPIGAKRNFPGATRELHCSGY